MMKYGIMGYVWSEWWSGMDYNLWNGVEKYKKWPAIHDMCYSIAERHQNLNFDMEMRWMKYGMRWMKYGMKWSMNEWMKWSMDG